MNSRFTPAVAAALVAAALAPAPAGAKAPLDPVAAAEAELHATEERLVSVEKYGTAPDEPGGVRAQRRFEAGERQYLLGDWFHAAVLLADAVDEPSWRGAADHGSALFLLADALRRQGNCGGARLRYSEYLAAPGGEHRPAAVSGALECAVKERRHADVDRLVAEAQRVFGNDPPAEVRYLAAKAAFQRTDLTPADRIARSLAAFERVGGSFQLQAWYFQGVLRLQQQNLHGSLQYFESCARAEPEDETQEEVRQLCVLALGRVHSTMGNADAALAWYAAIPWDSPVFTEAIQEMAAAYVRGKQYDRALRLAAFVPQLAPESPWAPEATLLQGHLLLRLGRYVEATDAYNNVINTYAPVRDEIDAVLSMQEDPLRYFNEIIGREGKAFEVASVLPPVAVRWATSSKEVGDALRLVRSIDQARRDVKDARDLAERLETLLQRGGGLDAFPALQRTYAQAQSVENAAARIEAQLVSALSASAEKVLPADRLAELAAARKARAAVEARFGSLPRTPEQVEERLGRMRERIDAVERDAFRTGYLIDGAGAAISGVEAWIDQHRTEVPDDARQEVTEELRKHRAIAEEYEAQLRQLRQEIAQARDAAGGVDAMLEESRVRNELLAAVERERTVAETARGSLADLERARFERFDPLRERLAAARARARAVKIGVASDATRRSAELRGKVSGEKVALAAHGGTLDGVQAVSKDLLGKIAVRSIADVRGQFYKLLLKADVGIVDVAWSRKRQRLDKIQQLSIQKAAEVDQLDRDYRAMLREVE